MLPALRTAADALIVAALAPRCAACAQPLTRPSAGPVCPACWSSVRTFVAPFCRACGDQLPSWRVLSVAMERCARCRRRTGALDAGRSAGAYEGALREIVHAFKYEGRRSLARPLGALIRTAGQDVLRDAHSAVPVPLHPLRRVARGFNQSSDLARTLTLPVVQALWRVRLTTPQTGLTAAARRRNVRGAFQLSPLLPRRAHQTCLRDRIVVLVDDVWTTGATLEACARVLKDAGAREVRALTIARATAPADRP